MAHCEKCGDSFSSERGLRTHWSQAHPNTPWPSDKICYNPKLLRKHYKDEGWTLGEIADEDGVSESTVANKMDDFGINRRQGGHEKGPWWDKDLLERLYLEERKSARKISERWDCAPVTIRQTLNKLNIPTRDGWDYDKSHHNACYTSNGDGYKVWVGENPGDRIREKVQIHQVLACVNNDPHEVFAEETHVHHGSDEHDRLPPVERRWANWRGNLEIMSNSEHMSYHRRKEQKQ